MSTISDSELLDLAARVFSGEASPEDRVLLARWSEATPINAKRLDRLQQGWDLSERRISNHDVDRAIMRVRIALASRERHLRPSSAERFVSSPTRRWVLGAVAATAALVSGFFVMEQPARDWLRESNRASAIPSERQLVLTTYATRNGQRANVVLPDGAVVMLNVASQLELPNNYGANDRTVKLTGEAYFRVTHIARTPFVVQAEGTRTEVLGTEFGVRAYDNAPVQVAVRSGKVSLNHTVLAQNDIAQVASNEVVVQRDQPLDIALGFANGRLVFHNIRLRDAIADLNRWYDADIRLADATLGDRMINAICTPGSIEELMDLLKLTFEANVVRNGRMLTVSSL